MRYLEVRRHTMRTKPGQHLSQRGVDLARRLGDDLGPYQRVITSTLPRALETAIAMGFAVDEEDESLSMMPSAIDLEVSWEAGCAAFAQAYARNGVTRRYSDDLAERYRAIAGALPEGGQALLVTHGGIIEAGTIGCLPHLDYRGWGPSCGYCEGVRLGYDGGAFVSAELLRLPERLRQLQDQ
jgi:broad specificity phosphatase PhoE